MTADQFALFEAAAPQAMPPAVAPVAPVAPVAREIRCNGCAWGLECERRDACAHRVPREEFEAACRNSYGLPSLDQSRRGYTLFACTPGQFEHFVHKETA